MELRHIVELAPVVPSFWIALVVSGVLMFPILRLLKALKSQQTISQYVPEHKAKQGTPTMGGLITLAGAVVALLYCMLFSHQSSVLPYLLLLIGFGIVGFVDDFVVPRLFPGTRGLGWKQKILMEIVFAAGPMALTPFGGPLNLLAATIVILFFANAYNFTDGLDGLAGSVGIALLVGLAGVSMLSGSESTVVVVVVGAAIVGGLIPFLVLNMPPAKLFMGDVGSLPFGAAIGLMFWQLGAASYGSFGTYGALLILSLVMIAELVPVPLQIASVKLRKKRIFPKTPIHHSFQDRGIAETRIVGAYLLSQIVCSALAISIVIWFGQTFFSLGLQVPVK